MKDNLTRNIKLKRVLPLKRLLPLLLVECYILLTYVIYRFGVWNYPYKDDNRVAVFLILCMIAFLLGYVLIIKNNDATETHTYNLPKWVPMAVCILGGFLLVPYCYGKTQCIYPPVFTSLQHLEIAYAQATNITQTASLLHYIIAVGRPFVLILFFITYFYWDDLTRRVKWFLFAENIWFILVEMSTGHNIGLFSYCIMLIILYFCWICLPGLSKNRIMKKTVITILALVIMPVYFSATLSSRGNSTVATIEKTGETPKEIITNDAEIYSVMSNSYGYVEATSSTEITGEATSSTEITGLDSIVSGEVPVEIIEDFENHKDGVMKIHPYYIDEFSYSYVDTESVLYKAIPERLRFLFVVGTSYISHGYYALSLALRIPYESSCGFGTFIIFQDIAQRITGIDFYKKTYVYKINQIGYPVSLKWGTAFIQFASDLSFPGVILLMIALGMLFSKLWFEVINERRIVSLLVLVPLGYNFVMITSWWQPGMSGSEFLLLNAPLTIWILQKIVKLFCKGRADNRNIV